MEKDSIMRRKVQTFKEWERLGYGVLKGSKSRTINEEFEATFTEKQVSKKEEDYDGGYDYLNCWGDIGDIC